MENIDDSASLLFYDLIRLVAGNLRGISFILLQ